MTSTRSSNRPKGFASKSTLTAKCYLRTVIPKLKAYEHLAGNYGGAWPDQADEFAEFPGAILMTSNCIQQPKVSYKERIFTSGAVVWPGVLHIADQDFSPVIAAALQAPGYEEGGTGEEITVGFGHNAVLSVADKVIDAVKAGAIRHFFLIGGCDGARSGRRYYTELAESIPADCLIMTLTCGKFRFNKLEFGEIGGLPRLLDIGPMQRHLLRVADRFGSCQGI